ASAAPGTGHAPAAASAPTAAGRIKASPLARRLAQEYELDLSAIRGTGPGGRVTRDDVLGAAEAVRTVPPAPQPAPAPAPEAVPEAVPTAAAAAGKKSLTRLQQTMARRMVESKTRAPHFYLTIHVDMTAALALRQQLNAEMEASTSAFGGAEEGAKISVNDLIVKAAARALAKFPTLNASYAGDTLTLHDEINVAVAVAIEDGLVTPVVRRTDQKSLGQIARET